MKYSLDINDEGYVLGICGSETGNLSEEERLRILAMFSSKPTPPDGYDYHLLADLTWELVKLPPAPVVWTQETLEAMTNAELERILAGFGITANMNKANLIRLILAAQGGDAK